MPDLKHSPTFLVGNKKQRSLLEIFKKREQNFSEDYQKNKPLCFQGRAYQKSHPSKVERGCTDADATLLSPMLLGVADGVSQIEDFGIDPSELPKELLAECEALALEQLYPSSYFGPQELYQGPIPLLRRAFEATEGLGSTTVLLTVLDNSTKIHGKLHPMIAVMSVGDCELLLLRRKGGGCSPFEMIFHTEMQRIDGHVQTPLQIARVDDRVYAGFDEKMTIDVIEKGSAVHCMCTFEGDIVIQGSDGVFDNLFLQEIVSIANEYLPKSSVDGAGNFTPTQPAILEKLARRIVAECHKKSYPKPDGTFCETPIGKGGKVDDTSCVVGEVVEWTEQRRAYWWQSQEKAKQESCFFCPVLFNEDSDVEVSEVCASGHAGSKSGCCWPQAARASNR